MKPNYIDSDHTYILSDQMFSQVLVRIIHCDCVASNVVLTFNSILHETLQHGPSSTIDVQYRILGVDVVCESAR
jgi:hypothetical protein